MLRELRETLRLIWIRLRRTENWMFGMSQMPLIIEEGTEGIWRYRKWSNGVAECWGEYDVNFTGPNTFGSTKYQSLPTINFPSNFFIERPVIMVGSNKVSGSGMPFVSLLGVNQNSFGGYIDDPSGGTYTTYLYFHAIGKHKQTVNTPENLIDYLYDNHVWDYNYLSNLPKINGQTVSGNKSLADYGFTGTIANDKIGYTTTEPTADNLDGLKIVMLDEEPATKYGGWLYLIKED